MMLVSSSARIAAVLAGLVLLSTPALAQGTAAQRKACMNDALRFCGPEIPNVRRIEACLIHYMNQLSPRCQAQFYRPRGNAAPLNAEHFR